MNWEQSIVNIFRRLKLINSKFTYEMQFSSDAESRFPIEDVCKNKVALELSKFILQNHPSSIKTENGHYSKNVKCSLFVFKEADFRTVIEAFIQETPQEIIDAIKNGKSNPDKK
jgi:hypothetical protein